MLSKMAIYFQGFVVLKFSSQDIALKDCYIGNFNTSQQNDPQAFKRAFSDPEVIILYTLR